MAIPYLACMLLAARVYALPPRVLPSIQAVEGGRAGLVHANTDGSDDYGVMQINSRWVPALARVAHLAQDDTRRRLIDQPCFNIAAAGLILRTYLNEAHGDLLRAVGYYHSHTPAHGASYRLRVIGAATRLFVDPRPPAAPSAAPSASPSMPQSVPQSPGGPRVRLVAQRTAGARHRTVSRLSHR